MICRIDSDILLWELCSCGQYLDDLTGELVIREWDFVQKLLDDKISQIYEATMSDGEPQLYLTNCQTFTDLINRRNRFLREDPLVFKPNFRFAIAKTKPYKGNRSAEKPHHFYNIFLYLYENYEVHLANGIEADDLMSIDASLDPENTVICSRDKDLRITSCWHYGWECGKQPEFPMQYVEGMGHISLNKAKKKVEGVGMKFFYAQMIMGDTVDNITGIQGKGYTAAYNALCDAVTTRECKAIVVGMYKEKYGERALEIFTEMAQLLWMLRHHDEEKGWNDV